MGMCVHACVYAYILACVYATIYTHSVSNGTKYQCETRTEGRDGFCVGRRCFLY